MGTYPRTYPEPAIEVAIRTLQTALSVDDRLYNDGWSWYADGPFLTAEEFQQIKLRFGPLVHNTTVLGLIGKVFATELPVTHFRFTTDGYRLSFRGYPISDTDCGVYVQKIPPVHAGYLNGSRELHDATLRAVRSIVEVRIADWRAGSDDTSLPTWQWPAGPWFIDGHDYAMIKHLGKFQNPRTKDVIDLIQAAAPDLRKQWQEEGSFLIPTYKLSARNRHRQGLPAQYIDLYLVSLGDVQVFLDKTMDTD